jgi:ubiquinone/menaquinone biosynthesis C-methylase UbiE/diadenosine tetraphosphate (Ap4A) HIT family hydrolase
MKTPPPMRQTLTNTISTYDDKASFFADRWDEPTRQPPALNEFLNALDTEAEVLDVGCGSGRDLCRLVEAGHFATGIDLSVQLLAIAHQRVPSATLRRMDARALLYPDCTFQGVWCSAVLLHMEDDDARAALLEIYRVLKARGVLGLTIEIGGKSSVTRGGRFHHQFEQKHIESLITDCGFKILSARLDTVTRGNAVPTTTWLGVIAEKADVRSASAFDVSCPFCPGSRLLHHRGARHPTAGAIIYGDSDFFVVPDLSPLCDGHVLLVSHLHKTSLSTCSQMALAIASELYEWLSVCCQKSFGRSAFGFEHGAARPRAAGSCIDHAHLHVLPKLFARIPDLSEKFGPAESTNILELDRYADVQPYLFLCQGRSASGVAYRSNIIPSQFLRSIMAPLVNVSEWRWKPSATDPHVQAKFRSTWTTLCAQLDGATPYHGSLA